jgi:quinolinate synthase
MITTQKQAHLMRLSIIHPEAAQRSRASADHVMSTGQMCEYARQSGHTEIIYRNRAWYNPYTEKRESG